MAWRVKNNENFYERKKGLKTPHFRNQPRNPPQVVTNTTRMTGDKPREPREPLQCWGCGEDHFIRNYPRRNGSAK